MAELNKSLAKERNLGWVVDVASMPEQPKKRRKPRKQPPLNSVCPMCESSTKQVSYKDVYLLKRFMSPRGKIIGRTKSGVCSKHQRQITKAIKKSRQAGLLPYVSID